MDDSKQEMRYRIIAESYKKLEILHYDEIIKILKEKEYHRVTFYDGFDPLNNIHYCCVDVMKNNDTSTIINYKAEDQDPRQIYNNMVAGLKKEELDAEYHILYNGDVDLICIIDTNLLTFPKQIVKDLRLCQTDLDHAQEGDIYCCDYKKICVFPSVLSEEVMQRRIKK